MNGSVAALDHLFEQAVSRLRVPGVTAVVADRTGLRYGRAFGARDTLAGSELEFDSVLGIASMTKTITAVVVLQLIESGELRLDTPVGDVLPAYDRLPVLTGFDGAEPILRPAARRGTVRNLLTNTSGLAHPTWNADLLRYLEVAGVRLADLAGSRRIFDIPFVCDPDEQFHYGMSTDWIGLLIEAVTGKPFLTVLTERVLDPLGMHDTTAVRTPGQLERAVSVHTRDGAGHWVPGPASYYGPGVVEPEVYPAGGCLFSTAPDFLRFQSALLDNGADLLRPESVDAMFGNQLGQLEVGLWRSEVPAASADLPLQGWKWGFGMLVNDCPGPAGRSAGSGGWGGGWNTFFWVDRAKGLTAAMYTQTAPFYDPGVIGLYHDFETLVSG